ncbi:copper homeostasis protein CutC [Sphingomonas sp. KR1UV-12]|uniref:PF03932 family protein CutC n=1 Tax=Sphingomonas aurea TaxID=3063994 RepID=A0ABT9EL02_9SPHN|nr:copper homeostasis protein CutC [Sphingomonas sp. KR1UV-12]MDP1027645.1 copper homeostasis protein CutC [Sphingomonas sp. KR1UV-12]
MSHEAVLLEICVEDVGGIDAARLGGADRIELCSALAIGGLTPSAALVDHAVASGLPVHAMVRPRQGDFVYDAATLDLMVAEIGHLRAMGVAGVVVGATHADGAPDRDALARLRDAAHGLRIVLHRAIDLAPDPIAAVTVAVRLGYDAVLSSGGAASAPAGAATLAAMVAEARGRIEMIAGAGVRPDTVAALIRDTGVGTVHASAAATRDWGDARIAAFGFAAGPSRSTDAAAVRALAGAIASRHG